jgi:hypothetical protein
MQPRRKISFRIEVTCIAEAFKCEDWFSIEEDAVAHEEMSQQMLVYSPHPIAFVIACCVVVEPFGVNAVNERVAEMRSPLRTRGHSRQVKLRRAMGGSNE